jgi:hypothetical protein
MPVYVDIPDGGKISFPDQKAADAFLKAAGPMMRATPTAHSGSSEQPTSADFMAADTETGGDAATRIGASFKMTREGKVGFLKSRYGDTNVFEGNGDDIYYRSKPGARLTLFDEKGFSLRDLADFAGDVPGMVLSGVGSIVGTGAGPGPGNVAGAAAGAAAGNVIKQNISNLLPGSDEMSPGQRVGSVALDTGLAAGTQFGANKLIPIADMARPHNMVSRSVSASMATPTAREGAELVRDVGPLTLGQETGSRLQLALEGLGRRSPASADKFKAFDDKQIAAAKSELFDLMDRVYTAPQTDFGIGMRVASSFDGLMDKLVTARRSQAATDFGRVGQLSNGGPVLSPKNLRAALREIIDEYDVPGGGDASAALVGRAKKMYEELRQPGVGEAAPSLTADQINRLLQIYGKASAGKGAIFQDMETAQQRLLAGKLHGALNADLDDAVALAEKMKTQPIQVQRQVYAKDPNKPGELVKAGEIAEALAAARDNYRKLSGPITEVRDSVIGKYFGAPGERTPERVADMLTRMKPSEMSTSLRLLERADPELRDATGRYFLERAMADAVPAPTQSQGGTVTFSAAKFLNALPDENMMKTLYGPNAHSEITKISRYLQRIADRPMDGSPTAPLLMAWDLAKGVFTLNPSAAIRGIGTVILAPNAIAKAATTPQGRQALLTVTNTSTPTAVAIKGATYLAGMNAVGSASEPRGSAAQD